MAISVTALETAVTAVAVSLTGVATAVSGISISRTQIATEVSGISAEIDADPDRKACVGLARAAHGPGMAPATRATPKQITVAAIGVSGSAAESPKRRLEIRRAPLATTALFEAPPLTLYMPDVYFLSREEHGRRGRRD